MSELTIFDSSPISETERQRFKELESVIQENIYGFRQVGVALWEIHNNRLYREHYTSFEAYLKQRWSAIYNDISKTHAYRLIAAAEVVADIEHHQKNQESPIGDSAKNSPVLNSENVDKLVDCNQLVTNENPASPTLLPQSESQVRPLASLSPEERGKVWEEAVTSSNGNQPTAKQVQIAVETHREKTGTKKPKKERQKSTALISWQFDLHKGKRKTNRYEKLIRPAEKERVMQTLSEVLRYLHDYGIVGFNMENLYYVTEKGKAIADNGKGVLPTATSGTDPGV